jgi:hypothetical protein
MTVFRFLLFTLPFLCGLFVPFFLALKIRVRFVLMFSLVGPLVLLLLGFTDPQSDAGIKSAIYLLAFEIASASVFILFRSTGMNHCASQATVSVLVAVISLSVFFYDPVLDSFAESAEFYPMVGLILRWNPFLVGCSFVDENIFTRPTMYRILKLHEISGWRYPDWQEPVMSLVGLSVIILAVGYGIRKIFKTGNLALTW